MISYDFLTIKLTKLKSVWFGVLFDNRNLWFYGFLHWSWCLFSVELNRLERVVIDRNDESWVSIGWVIDCIDGFENKRGIDMIVFDRFFDSVKIFLIVFFSIGLTGDLSKDGTSLIKWEAIKHLVYLGLYVFNSKLFILFLVIKPIWLNKRVGSIFIGNFIYNFFQYKIPLKENYQKFIEDY